MRAAEPLFLRLLPSWFRDALPGRRVDAPARAAHEAARAPAPLLTILDMALRVPRASSAEDLAAAIAEKQVHADLDPELADGAGFPILTARCLDAGDETVRDDIAAWLVEEGLRDVTFADEGWRALALAGGVAGELASIAASEGAVKADGIPSLMLVTLAPAGWTAAQRDAARGWLLRRIEQSGWPRERVAVGTDVAAGEAHGAPFVMLARLAADLAPPESPQAALVVVFDSAIGKDAIARRAAQGELLSASHAQGVVPGEGAVALLVGAVDTGPAAEAPAAVLALPAHETDAEAALAALTARALQQAQLAAADVALLVADTGHRPDRVLELMGHAARALPHLDVTDGVVRAGLACGTCGPVPLFAALALAWHAALERNKPVLCIGNEQANARGVALIRPQVR